MKEEFLHFVWKTLNFDFTQLRTTDGEPVQILLPGLLNTNQGPDFLQGKVRIGGLEWNGQIEIHLKSSDWYAHKHQFDPAYNAVVLHVVFENDRKQVLREDGTVIPEIVLKDRIPNDVLRRYHSLNLSEEKIPCAGMIGTVDAFHIHHWIERLAVERIAEKSARMGQRLHATISDWDQVLWEELAAYLGGTVNQVAFRELAQRIPVRRLQKLSSNPLAIESILYGMSGMLIGHSGSDSYLQKLQQEWAFQSQKLSLGSNPINIRYLRMRPTSFPTLRLSQLASILQHFPSLSHLMTPQGIQDWLKQPIQANAYWTTHYRFLESSSPHPCALGDEWKRVLLLNTFVPLAFLYLDQHGREKVREDLVELLNGLPSENNRIIREFEETGVSSTNALQSQGLIQLKKRYCLEKNCLNCAIGYHILKAKKKLCSLTLL